MSSQSSTASTTTINTSVYGQHNHFTGKVLGISDSSAVSSDMTGSMVVLAPSLAALQDKNEQLKKILGKVNVVTKRKSVGKNDRRKRQKTTEIEINNGEQLRNMFKKKIFPHWKIKVPGWETYNTAKRSICSRALRVTTPGPHMTPEVWWKMEGASAISDVWCAIVANIKQTFYKVLEGEYRLLAIIEHQVTTIA